MAHTLPDLYPQLRIELPGIPEPTLVDGVWEAVDRFLREAEVWKYTVPGLLDWTTALTFPAIAAGTEIPAFTRIVRIDSVKFANDGVSFTQVPFKTRQQADAEYPRWEVDTGTKPDIVVNDGMDGGPGAVISPIAVADVLTSLKVRVVLGSSGPGLTTLPEFIVHEFGDLIRSAALARLMKIPGKDWTNFQLSASNEAIFTAGVIRAKSRAEAGFGQPKRATSYGGI